MIRITSKKEGFYRCGLPHPSRPTDYPDDRFSEKELEILAAEPMLTVEGLEGDPESPPESKQAGQSPSTGELSEREADLDERENKLDQREKELSDREALLERRYREPVLKAAITVIVEAGNNADFTATGLPKTEAITIEAGGLDISAAERDQWFTELNPPEGG